MVINLRVSSVDSPENHTVVSHVNHADGFYSGQVLSDGKDWNPEQTAETHSC